MELNILYFGMIVEITHKNNEVLTVHEKCNSSELENILAQKYIELSSLNYKIAIDKEIVTDTITLEPTNEIALLPPFSGG